MFVSRVLCLLWAVSCFATSRAQEYYKEWVELGMSQLEHDSLVEAETSFRKAMTVSPALKSNAILFRHIGQIQERTGREKDALESYTLGINLSPTTIGLLLDRASLYLRMGNDSHAIADYTSILDLNADHKDALFFRAYLYTKGMDYKRGRADYEHLLKLEPNREDALQGLALLNSKDNRPREAMEQVNTLVQLYPYHATNYVMRGEMALERKQYENALYDFDKAISLEPENPEFLISRACCYIAMKQKKSARKDLQLALQLGADKMLIAQLLQDMK